MRRTGSAQTEQGRYVVRFQQTHPRQPSAVMPACSTSDTETSKSARHQQTTILSSVAADSSLSPIGAG